MGMREVLDRVEQRQAEFARLPLFAFLADSRIDARRRLSFAPGVAHFVMSFADLYARVLFEDPAKDEYQEIVNHHTKEDDGHWRWFLVDLAKLGFDRQLAYTDALKLVWNPRTVRMRMLSYRMCQLGYGASSLRKLVLVHCIEATGKVTVEHVAKVGDEVAAQTGQKLTYFGSHHSDTENAHTLESADVRKKLRQIELEPAVSRELLAMVDDAFRAFEGFAADMLMLASEAHVT
jgi:hypothetical protein